MPFILLISLVLMGCGGSSGGSSSSASSKSPVVRDGELLEGLSCLANERNCSDADVDLDAPVIWAADNGIKIVHIRWAGCASDAAAKYAFERGVTIICLAADDGKMIVENSPYTITIGSTHAGANYGPGVDYVLLTRGTIHSGIYATGLVATGREIADWNGLPADKFKHSDETILIVDNGFDSVRPLYVLYKNTALAGEITGDYGVRAISELRQWTDAPVIGYVPFNSAPEEPRIDNW